MPLSRTALAFLLLWGTLVSALAVETPLPDVIAAPGEPVVLTMHAEGAQVYECKAGADGKLGWAFREPIATLLADGKTVGRHYAGPNWEHSDGSAVTGKVVGSVPGAAANDIPWLKLEVASRRGSGILTAVTTLRLQKRNVLEFLTATLAAHRRGQRGPSLLPDVATDQLALVA